MKRPSFFYSDDELTVGASPGEVANSHERVDADAPVDGEKSIDWDALDEIPEPTEKTPGEEKKSADSAISTLDKARQEKLATEAAEKAKEPVKEEAKTEEKPEANVETKTEAKTEEKAVTEADIDKLHPAPGWKPETRQQWDTLKSLTKQAVKERDETVAKVQTYEKELAELRTKVSELPAEAAKELEQLRGFRQMVMLGDDPDIKAQFSATMEKADQGVCNMLKSVGVSDEIIGKMKEKGLDSYNEKWWEEQVLAKINNPLARRRMEDALLHREGAKENHQSQLAQLSSNREQIAIKQQENQKKGLESFNSSVEKEIQALAKENPWAARIEIPETATKEQKAEWEKHNIEFEQHRQRFIESGNKVYSHDPAEFTRVMFNAHKLPMVEEQLSKAKEEVESSKARIAELEADIAAAQKTGRVGSKTAPAKTSKNGSMESIAERQMRGEQVDADEAFRALGV